MNIIYAGTKDVFKTKDNKFSIILYDNKNVVIDFGELTSKYDFTKHEISPGYIVNQYSNDREDLINYLECLKKLVIGTIVNDDVEVITRNRRGLVQVTINYLQQDSNRWIYSDFSEEAVRYEALDTSKITAKLIEKMRNAFAYADRINISEMIDNTIAHVKAQPVPVPRDPIFRVNQLGE